MPVDTVVELRKMRNSGGTGVTGVTALAPWTTVPSSAGNNPEAVTLADNTKFIDVSFSAAVYACPSDFTTDNGCMYQPNIVYRIPTPNGTFFAEAVAEADCTAYITCFTGEF